MATRKIVSVKNKSVDKKQEFVKHAKALNRTFYEWFNSQVTKDSASDLVDSAQDYLAYLTSLQDRYLRSHGEVLTFGSGDCGQLAHGTDNEEDMLVKFPRIVYSLRDKKVCMISCGGLHNAVVTETGHVYTWGCSDDGSLGREGEEELPELVTYLADAGESIIRVGCGDGQTVAVTTSGSVYAWGCFKDKEGKKWFSPDTSSGNTSEPEKTIKRQQDVPMKVDGLQGVVDVTCSGVICLALLRDGSILSWGIGECGELGRDVCVLRENEDVGYDFKGILKDHLTPGPMYVDVASPTGKKKIKVSGVRTMGCGVYHTMVVVGGGSGATGIPGGLYCSGLNNYGQLGFGNTTNSNYLKKVDCAAMDAELESGAFDTVVSCAGGMHHSCVAMASGRVFCFGRGDNGQLGIKRYSYVGGGEAGGYLESPQEVPLGDNKRSNNKNYNVVQKIADKEKVVEVACGGSHTLALTKGGDLYSWGYGDMMALGHGKDADEPEPKKVSFQKAKLDGFIGKQISGGGQHSALIARVESVR